MAEQVAVSPKVAAYVERLNSTIERYKTKAIESKTTFVTGGSALAGAFLGSFSVARYPDKKVLGADVDLAAALICAGGAMMTSGLTQDVLGGAAVGFGCSAMARLGSKKGAEKLAEAVAAGGK